MTKIHRGEVSEESVQEKNYKQWLVEEGIDPPDPAMKLGARTSKKGEPRTGKTSLE